MSDDKRIPQNKGGRRPGYAHSQVTRQRIRASYLMGQLYYFAMGKPDPRGHMVSMSPTQVQAALGFLRKVVPDLKTIEHTGEVTHRHVEDMTDEELLAVARSRCERTVAEATGEGDDTSVH